jgi:hypothetical protein
MITAEIVIFFILKPYSDWLMFKIDYYESFITIILFD